MLPLAVTSFCYCFSLLWCAIFFFSFSSARYNFVFCVYVHAGVGSPGHFLVAFRGDVEIVIDPFHGGALMTMHEAHSMLEARSMI
jgi:hypothetical protein